MAKLAGRAVLCLLLLLAVAGAGLEWLSALRLQRGRDAYDAGDYYKALDQLKGSAGICRDNPEVHRWLAKTYARLIEGRNAETQLKLLRSAEQEMEKALKIESGYPYYWYDLALVSQLTERLGEKPSRPVMDCYRKALLLDHNNPVFLQYFGDYLLAQGRKQEAKSLLKKLIGIDLRSSLFLARSWVENGYDPQELIPDFSGNQEALIKFGEMLPPKYHEAARAVSKRAFEQQPNNPEARLAYARSLIGEGRCQELEKIVRPLFSRPGYELKAYGNHALCLSYAKKYDAAAEQYLQMIRINPDDINSRDYLAKCYLIMGRTELAKEQLIWLASKFTHDSGRADTYLKLANIYEKERDPEQAVKYYKLYLELKPGDKAAGEKLSRLQTSAGKGKDIIYSPWEIKNEKEQ